MPCDIMPDKVKSYFKDQLDMRCRNRAKRLKEEKNVQRKMERAERRQYENNFNQWGEVDDVERPEVRLRLNSFQEFPECGASTPPLVSSRPGSPSYGVTEDAAYSLTNIMGAMAVNTNTFAQRLKTGSTDTRRKAQQTEEIAGPSHGCTLGDAVEAAFLRASMEQGVIQTKNGKKKKKPKPVPLCSMGVFYGN